jgi:hypothetical protein
LFELFLSLVAIVLKENSVDSRAHLRIRALAKAKEDVVGSRADLFELSDRLFANLRVAVPELFSESIKVQILRPRRDGRREP